VGLVHAGRHVDGPEHRLGVGRIDGFSPARLLSPLPAQVVAEVELVGHLGQRHRVDDGLAHVGQLASLSVG
jgi:hypothetical protein